ncbi:MAG: hypothetical protein ACR2KS_00185 [Candidatus Eremiobacter antarcticus]|nr:hypothetical protein [Candidatus Eremiobacteraeota bacterium]
MAELGRGCGFPERDEADLRDALLPALALCDGRDVRDFGFILSPVKAHRS